MHLHILGICGTFMAGIAALAREAGHTVTGSDANGWPPMSTQLEQLGIKVMPGYLPEHLDPAPDVVVVGNVSVGGTGKTPLTLALVEHLRRDADEEPHAQGHGHAERRPARGGLSRRPAEQPQPRDKARRRHQLAEQRAFRARVGAQVRR